MRGQATPSAMALLFSAFLLSLWGSAMSAADDRCLMLDSCYFKMEPKTCSCQADCHLFGTCCFGVKKETPDPVFRCYGRRTREALFVRRSCKPGYRGHPHDSATCFDDDEDEADVVNNLLVTNRRTQVTYWNKQCARCNEEDVRELEVWDVVVQCEAAKGVTKDLLRKLLHFDPEKGRWGVMIGDLFMRCILHYAPPASLQQIKYCNRNLIETCPPDYPDHEMARKCSQSYAERKLKNGDVYFRNVHCALCNGYQDKDVECVGMWTGPEDSAEESDFRDMTEVTFSGGEWLHREPGRLFECTPGYVYDPFRGRCRTYRTEEVGNIDSSSAPYRSGVPLLLLATLSLVLLL